MEVKSRPHSSMHGKSMFTEFPEFLHGRRTLWEWWGESILHVHPTIQPMLGYELRQTQFVFVNWVCRLILQSHKGHKW